MKKKKKSKRVKAFKNAPFTVEINEVKTPAEKGLHKLENPRSYLMNMECPGCLTVMIISPRNRGVICCSNPDCTWGGIPFERPSVILHLMVDYDEREEDERL